MPDRCMSLTWRFPARSRRFSLRSWIGSGLTGHFLPLGMIFVAGLLAFLGFVSVRYRESLLTALATRWLISRRHGDQIGERVLIVGVGECGLLANWLLQRSNLAAAFAVIGMVDDDPTKQGMTVDGYRVLDLPAASPRL